VLQKKMPLQATCCTKGRSNSPASAVATCSAIASAELLPRSSARDTCGLAIFMQ